MGSIGSRGFRAAWISLACVAVSTSSAAAAADYFLKFEGLKGESSDRILSPVPRDAKPIAIESFSWGATQMGSGGGGSGGLGAGKVSMSDLSVMRGPRQTTSLDGPQVTSNTAVPDPSAQGLAVSDPGASGPKTTSKRQHWPVNLSRPLDRGSITLRGVVTGCAGGTTYRSATLTSRAYKIKFQDVFITSCATAGGGGGGGAGAPPMDSISFNYEKIVTKATSAADKTQWDLAKAKKL